MLVSRIENSTKSYEEFGCNLQRRSHLAQPTAGCSLVANAGATNRKIQKKSLELGLGLFVFLYSPDGSTVLDEGLQPLLRYLIRCMFYACKVIT